MDTLLSSVVQAFGQLQQWLFESAIVPALFAMGLGNRLEDAYLGTGWLLVGLIQIALMLLVIAPLQRRWPVEHFTPNTHTRTAVRTDVIYTLIHRLGVFRLAFFFTLEPVIDDVFGWLRVAGVDTWSLDGLWPGITDQAWVSFVLYLVVFDFVNYWVHRGQHQWDWWWSLHAVHHSQRQMTMWTDNRNHLLDDVLRDALMAVLALLLGAAPEQFVAIVALTQLSENFQHANLKCWFGKVGERLWVSPRFHRLHHSVGIGHESHGPQTLGGHNFGVLLPWWDMCFGTANFEQRYDPTGIRDQIEQGRNYGDGFWQQQWLGLKRLVQATP
jgi:sterol desaturase/sphingolipid hydroxylase (fatty acid hydroxylase superfamily)